MKQKSIVQSSQWLMLLSFVLVQLIPLGVKLIWGTWGSTPEKWALTISIQLVAILTPAWIFSNLYFKDSKGCKLYEINRISIFTVIICIISGIALQFVSIIANSPLIALIGQSGEYTRPPSDAESYMLAICSVVIIPVICEELFFRGVFLSAQLERGAVRAIIITTFIFSLFHHDITAIAGNLLLGFYLALSAIYTKTVLSSMIVHLCYNGTGFLLQYVLYPYFDDMLYYICALLAVPVLVFTYNRFKLPITEKSSTAKLFFSTPIIMLMLTYLALQYIYFRG